MRELRTHLPLPPKPLTVTVETPPFEGHMRKGFDGSDMYYTFHKEHFVATEHSLHIMYIDIRSSDA